jgi:hypothetical protein
MKGGQAVGEELTSMDHLQGCVRRRMLRLGQMTLLLFAETRGAIGLDAIGRNLEVGNA